MCTPNPSTSGVFSLKLSAELWGGALLAVTDVLGRQVKSQALLATAVGSKSLSLDLSGKKAGIYTLQISLATGVATRKTGIN